MQYFLCLLPPVAILTTGFKPFTFLVNLGLSCLFYIPGVIHAVLVVNKSVADKRHNQILDAMAAQSGVRKEVA